MISSNPPRSSSTSLSTASSHTLSGYTSEIVMGDISIDNEENCTASSNASVITPVYQKPQNEDRQAKRRGRKGHTKSKAGCYNCKKARIKVCSKPSSKSGKRLNYTQCKENRPSCDYCSHRDLICEWPDLQVYQVNQGGTMIRKATPAPIPATIHTQGPVFTMQDFRLFNHFIQTAYPHHPPLNDSVWTHEIPSIAADVMYSCTAASEAYPLLQYDFLLHSMLALSASDIAEFNPSPANSELACVAMSHRVKAISCLNEAIGKPISSMEQGNAMIIHDFHSRRCGGIRAHGSEKYWVSVRTYVRSSRNYHGRVDGISTD
jgi:hypothetical protein